jgi:hypothetical protein
VRAIVPECLIAGLAGPAAGSIARTRRAVSDADDREPFSRVGTSTGVSANLTDSEAIGDSLSEPRSFGGIFGSAGV